MRVRKYFTRDIPIMIDIWNEAVAEGSAFAPEASIDPATGDSFFSSMSYSGLAVDFGGNTHGMYILSPCDKCEGTARASFAVKNSSRGQKVGQDLVTDCIKNAKSLGFNKLMLEVAEDGTVARHIFEKLGFTQTDMICGGLKLGEGRAVNLVKYCIDL